MKRFILGLMAAVFLILILFFYQRSAHSKNLQQIISPADVAALFSKSAAHVDQRMAAAMESLKKDVEKFLAIPADQRTFENTAQALDIMLAQSDLAILNRVFRVSGMVYPSSSIRAAVYDAVIRINDFFRDEISMSQPMYQAWKWYFQNIAPTESLTEKQRYFVEYLDKQFKRDGLDLLVAQQKQLKALEKELAILALDFEGAIAQSKLYISATEKELDGLDADFIANLKRDETGNYVVGVDYPTYYRVMEQCNDQNTRARLWHQFMHRGYPENKTRLEKIIALRDELAKILGYSSFAAYELEQEMVQTPERAQQFLHEILPPAIAKEGKEVALLRELKTDNVTVTADGKLYPWDSAYLKYQYKKQNFSLDEQEVSLYFPLEHTIDRLLNIYTTFFGVDFEHVTFACPWADDVTMLAVKSSATQQILGYLILDLFPRENKYSHAMQVPIISSTYYSDGKPTIALSIVLANFPRPTATKPSLLSYKNVSTFFHEFGHALHALLGRNEQALLAGTETKRDFVEMPSQMLEELLYDREILQKVSAHYQTGQPLPDTLIDALVALKTFESGYFIARQCKFALMALAYFASGPIKDVEAIQKQIHKLTRKYTVYIDDDADYATLNHLTGYGSRYYGYLWSKVFAMDLFAEIKKEGLLNPAVGRRYVQTILAPGGSKDPNVMLHEFLGREPNQEAFLRDLGFVKKGAH